MRKALWTLTLLAAFAVALAGPVSRFVSRVDATSVLDSQHAEVIIGPPGGG